MHAYVGHSAGALTLMAARQAGHVSATTYVLICAPTHPFPAVNVIRRKLGPRPGVIARYCDFVAGQFGTNWESLRDGTLYQGLGANALLVFDTMDRFVDHS